MIYKIIDSYEEFCEKVIVPIIRTGKDVVLENEYINPILKLRSEFLKQKVNLYFEHLNLKTEEEKINFLHNLNDEQKIFFTETVNKTIDLNDNIQNYIMSYLTEEYIKNDNLNYFQKKLYYNINSLSEEDFQIFYCFYKKYLDNFKLQKGRIDKIIYNVNSEYINKDMINISLSRFSNIGILIYKNETKQIKRYMDLGQKENEIDIHTNEYYIPTDYSNELFSKLENIFKDFNCSDILKMPKNDLHLW
ncbi:hypothetical protein NG754_03155 [Aliarcobacter cryaerophilus]|uniref:hypothetical protein n=1 Tax=Aliarcobacter cryaerophilus TaxID=28198 RepID=UPI003DA4C6EC